MLLREILEITRAQEEALSEDRIDRFDQLLDVRAGLIQRVQEIAADASPEEAAPAPLPANVIQFPLAPHGAANEDALALDTLLQGIIEGDRRNEQALARKLDEIRLALPAMESHRRGTERYRVSAEGARFIDRAS